MPPNKNYRNRNDLTAASEENNLGCDFGSPMSRKPVPNVGPVRGSSSTHAATSVSEVLKTNVSVMSARPGEQVDAAST